MVAEDSVPATSLQADGEHNGAVLIRSDKQAVRQINSKATRAPAACSILGTRLDLATQWSQDVELTSVRWLRPASARQRHRRLFDQLYGGVQPWHASSVASPPRTRRPSASLTTGTSA